MTVNPESVRATVGEREIVQGEFVSAAAAYLDALQSLNVLRVEAIAAAADARAVGLAVTDLAQSLEMSRPSLHAALSKHQENCGHGPDTPGRPATAADTGGSEPTSRSQHVVTLTESTHPTGILAHIDALSPFRVTAYLDPRAAVADGIARAGEPHPTRIAVEQGGQAVRIIDRASRGRGEIFPAELARLYSSITRAGAAPGADDLWSDIDALSPSPLVASVTVQVAR